MRLLYGDFKARNYAVQAMAQHAKVEMVMEMARLATTPAASTEAVQMATSQCGAVWVDHRRPRTVPRPSFVGCETTRTRCEHRCRRRRYGWLRRNGIKEGLVQAPPWLFSAESDARVRRERGDRVVGSVRVDDAIAADGRGEDAGEEYERVRLE